MAESHSYDRAAGIWIMRQGFRVKQAGRVKQFAVTHQLRMRPAEEYVAALEGAGFIAVARWPAYPGTPAHLADERRVIVSACRDR